MSGTRNTVQGTIVQNALFSLGNHPTADEVYERVHMEYPSISRATVYRALNKLADQGNALKVHTAQGGDRFDHNSIPHAHVQCSVCNRVFDVDIDFDESCIKKIEDQIDCKILSAGFQFIGVCSECQKNGCAM